MSFPKHKNQKQNMTKKALFQKSRGSGFFYIVCALLIVFLYTGYSKVFAVSSPYNPGATLDPACAPGDPNCTVAITPTYTNATPTPTTVGGIAAGSTFSGETMQQMLNALLYPYIAPTTTIALSPSAGLRETGNIISSVGLTSTTTKHTDPITTFTYSKTSSGVIYTDGSPNPSGGSESYTDGTGVSTNTTYTATVGDGTSTGTATASYSFTYAYYYGVGAPGLTPAQVAGLTKVIQTNQSSYTTTTSPSDQVFYFAYPDSYPALTEILDPNGFNITDDFTVTTGNSITNSFGSATTYRIYQYNNLTTQTGFAITYKE